MNDMKDYMISKNKAEEYEKKKAMADSVYAKGKARVYPQAKRVKEDVILDAIAAEIRSLICEYQDKMSKEFEQCLKNLLDQIEGYKQ
jgi:hypothetical protein